MGFEQDPDYEFLRGLFKQVMAVHNFQFDSDFDWISRTVTQVNFLVKIFINFNTTRTRAMEQV
jgi:hypothetical protein